MMNRLCFRALLIVAALLVNSPLLADGLEPFTPPPLADLDAKANWIDQPVVDAMELRRKKEEAEKKEPTTAASAPTPTTRK